MPDALHGKWKLKLIVLRVKKRFMSAENTTPIGFKEWAFVCEALGQGAQTIILRKGGIHEGRGGFHFQHDAFWLFPTGFHNQGEQLRWSPPNATDITVPRDEERETVNIRYFATLHGVWRITDWDKVAALEPLHVWKDEVVRDRFAWNEESCLHVALVRVSACPQLWSFPYQPGYGGCRSWVKLPQDGAGLEKQAATVLSDQSWNDTAAKVRALLD
jgi:hypothetical protein